jgi:hypothetical protein
MKKTTTDNVNAIITEDPNSTQSLPEDLATTEWLVGTILENLGVVIVAGGMWMVRGLINKQKQLIDKLGNDLYCSDRRSRILKEFYKNTHQILSQIIRESDCHSVCVLELHNGHLGKNVIPNKVSVTFEVPSLGVPDFQSHLQDIPLDSIKEQLETAVRHQYIRLHFTTNIKNRLFVLDIEELYIFAIGSDIRNGFVLLIYKDDTAALTNGNPYIDNNNIRQIGRIQNLAQQIKYNCKELLLDD